MTRAGEMDGRTRLEEALGGLLQLVQEGGHAVSAITYTKCHV